jgi:acyl carrier protein
MSVEKEIINIIVEQLGVAPEIVDRKKSFVEDLNADSLDITELVMTIEERFDVEIPQDQAELMKTVGDLVDFVVRIKNPARQLETDSQKTIGHQNVAGSIEQQ